MTVALTATPHPVAEIANTISVISHISQKMRNSKFSSQTWRTAKVCGDSICESQYARYAASSANTSAAKEKAEEKGEAKAKDSLAKALRYTARTWMTKSMRKFFSEDEAEAKVEANAKACDHPEKGVAAKATPEAKTDRS